MSAPYYTARPLSFFPVNNSGAVSGKAILIPENHPIYIKRWNDNNDALCSTTWKGKELHVWCQTRDLYERQEAAPDQNLSCFV